MKKQDRVLLLVEDNPLDAELTSFVLNQAFPEYRIEVVMQGQEALDFIFGRGPYQDRSRYPFPQAVFLDLYLPDLDGFEILKTIRQSPETKTLPVIMLTGSRNKQVPSRSFEYGASGFLEKPVSLNDLTALKF